VDVVENSRCGDEGPLLARSIPAEVSRVAIATGHRVPWKEIVPADPAGVESIPSLKFSADGKSYAYSTGRILSDRFVVDGLKRTNTPRALIASLGNHSGSAWYAVRIPGAISWRASFRIPVAFQPDEESCLRVSPEAA
jgi:hypothetical protein